MNTNQELAYPSYIAVALQARTYGCRNRSEIQKNLQNQIDLIDESFANSYLVGGGAVKVPAAVKGR